MLGTVLGIGANIASQYIGGHIQEHFNKKQHQRNLDYYNMQRQDALSDWTRNNEYNLPTNQVQRLRDAGINPHAALGGINQAAASTQARTSSMGASPTAYNVKMQNAVEVASMINQMKQQTMQTKLLEQEVNEKKIDVNVKANYSHEQARANVENTLSQIANTNANTDERKQNLNNLQALYQNILQNTALKRIQEIRENVMMQPNKELVEQQIRNLMKQAQKIDAEIQNIGTQTNINNTRLRYMDREIQEQIRRLSGQSDYQDIVNYYAPAQKLWDSRQSEYRSKLDKNQLEFLETLPPEMRYIFEKGGDVFKSFLKK